MPIAYIEWNRNGLCGAACAQMVLHARGLVGTTQPEQENLWTSIKVHTNAHSSAAPGAACSGVIAEVFDDIVREACAAGNVLCWSTHPLALKGTLKTEGQGVALTLSKIADEDRANSTIRKCLQRGAVPIVLINGGTHWVVVDAWDDNAPSPVSMLDPAVGAPSSHTIEDWNNDFMSIVECGKFIDKYVILQVG